MERNSYKLPEPLITTADDWLGGEPCFTGRRVPIKALFDYLKNGLTIDRFVEDYPSVSKEHAIAVLEQAGRRLLFPAAAE